MNCPICEKELITTYRDTLDSWCLMEEEKECPNKHYRYFYATGYTSIFVGKYESLSYSYDREPSKIELSCHRLRIFIAKQKYWLCVGQAD